jgi:hypothetical protein
MDIFSEMCAKVNPPYRNTISYCHNILTILTCNYFCICYCISRNLAKLGIYVTYPTTKISFV